MAERTGFDFEEVDFLESFLAMPVWQGTEMIVAARAFCLCGDHELADERRPRSGRLVFVDVARSTRTVYEYTGERGKRGYRPGYVVEDGGTREDGGDLTEYRFGGVHEVPHAWVEWTIRALRFDLELDQE